MPALTAYILVELGAIVVPRWSRLRHVPGGRAKLDRAARVLMLVLGGFQAFGVVRNLEALDMIVPPLGGVVAGVTLVAGTALLVALGAVVTRRGLVNGFALLLATGWAQSFLATLGESFAGTRAILVEPRELPLLASSIAIMIAATLVCTARADAAEIAPRATMPFRGGAARGAASPWIPTPASSYYPLTAAASLMSAPAVLENFGVRLPGLQRALGTGLGFTLVLVGLSCILGIVLALVMHRAEDVASFARRLGAAPESALADARAAFSHAMPPTLLFLVAIALAQTICDGLPHLRIAVLQVPLLVAVGRDVVRAALDALHAPDLVTVWEERRPYAVAAIRATLGAEGIDARARGMGVATMLQAFAPYAPVEVQVRAADAEHAEARLRHLLLGAPEPPPRSASDTPRDIAPRAALSPRMRSVALGALAGVAAVLAGVAYLRPSEDTGGPIARAKLEIDLVDDEIDPFPSDEGLPEGVAIYRESVSLGPGRSAPHPFARIVPRSDESIPQAIARVRPWLAALPLPPGERFALQDVSEHDEETGKETLVGARTFVLRAPPIVTEDDLDDAEATMASSGPYPEPYVAVVFKPAAAERFRVATRDNVQRRIAIVVDGRVDSVPVVKSEIGGGHASITLGAAPDLEQQLRDAKRLARSLRGR
jgi:hypothetical protein